VSDEPSAARERVRTAEVVAALCLATDLAMGFPFEHGLHATQIAIRLGERLGVDPQTASEAYYACLLSYCGCTVDAEVAAEVTAVTSLSTSGRSCTARRARWSPG
jgi:hypothetical protein